MSRHIWTRGGVAATLVAAFALGSVTLGGAFAQTTSPQPPAAAGQQTQQPSYTGSIQVAQDQNGQSEQAEAAALASQARISADQARTAALAQFPNATIGKVELDNENGTLVYSVHLTDSSGQAQDVKVDAGNAKVLHTEADGPEGNEMQGVED